MIINNIFNSWTNYRILCTAFWIVLIVGAQRLSLNIFSLACSDCSFVLLGLVAVAGMVVALITFIMGVDRGIFTIGPLGICPL